MLFWLFLICRPICTHSILLCETYTLNSVDVLSLADGSGEHGLGPLKVSMANIQDRSIWVMSQHVVLKVSFYNLAGQHLC